jgi:hypothetical protein
MRLILEFFFRQIVFGTIMMMSSLISGCLLLVICTLSITPITIALARPQSMVKKSNLYKIKLKYAEKLK